MRVPVALLLAAGLFGCTEAPAPAPVAAYVAPTPTPPSDHAAACVRPAEKAAFDVTSLKSQLMVTAISCGGESKYNAFVTKYRSSLVGDDKSLTAFFGRAYGRRGQQAHDDFVTQLANAQSELSLKFGTNFCRANAPLLDEVMTKAPTDLPAYAASKPIQQSMAVEECSGTAAAAPATTRTTTRKR